MTYEFLIVETDGPVRTITLNRPKVLNAWHTAMRRELIEALDAASADPEVKAVVLTGAGDRAFGAGQDLNDATALDGDGAERWIDEFRDLYAAVRRLEIPVVAALNGVAAGSAFQFVLLTDIRIGHAGSRMGQPEINSGIASITGPWIMREVVGMSRTIELTLTGRLVDGEEALSLGFLHHLVPQAEVLPRAKALAAELAAKPPTAMRLIKKRFWEVLEPGLDEAVAAAKRYHRESFEAGEPQATAKAFLEARGGLKSGA